MANVFFTENIQRYVSCPPQTVAGRTVREVLERVFEILPTARGYVVDEQGRLRKHMIVFIDGRQISDRIQLTDAVGESSEVRVMQALSGG